MYIENALKVGKLILRLDACNGALTYQVDGFRLINLIYIKLCLN